jgi:tetratricopeptide (TPR) repeat protein
VWEEYYRAAGSLAGCGSLVENGDDLYAVEAKALAQVGSDRAKQLLANTLKRSKRAPADPRALNNLAWLLATRPEPAWRDPPRAVELATRAVLLAPKAGSHWNTLGITHCRAGDWKAAVTALEKSRELSKGGNSFDWFFLAMAHWQLGDKEQARTWYDQAVQWMEKNQPNDAELCRFRAEAAQLLQLTEPTEEEKVQRKEQQKSPSKL